MCPSRDPPPCVPASRRYRTHDGTCNNRKRPRWGAAQMPFHRFLAPEYTDGVESIRRSISGSPLPSARFVSLVVHGSRQEEAPVTMMLAMWGQLLDHDLTATAQPRSLNGSTPRCCGKNDDGLHPSCLPIKVPVDDPWLSPLGVRCLEFLRSAPAQRRDCLLSWREQTNQVTSYIDASPIYSSNPRTSDNARIFRDGLLLFGRGPPNEDVCFRAALANQCIRPGDARSGEQPGLLMLHMVWVNEHNQIATELSTINPHWSDEKLYQETRRIVGAMFQHITFREFLPVILGKEVCNLFGLDLETSGFYKGYEPGINPTVANEFSSAAFRFGHSLIQGSYMRADRHHRFIANNVTLHEETAEGDMGGPGSLHRLVRGLVNQRALKRDEFITAELTNHLFQTSRFPFGLDLAAINIQRGRDHGLQPYVNWRIPCGLTAIKRWEDLDRVMGPASAHRLRKAYRSVDDIDLFVGGLAERPVVGGIVGPTFACIIAQQFSNLRKGDRFWYENPGFESSFTPAQLESIRQVAFSQVLCRSLGGGTLQPHVFLPADIVQNERLPCDSKLMAPIDLEPWTERDPFTRPNDSPSTGESENQIDFEALQSLFSTTSSTTRRPTKGANIVNKVDFVPNGNIGLQIPQNGQIVLNSPQPASTVVNNKIDFNVSTARPSSLSQTASTRPPTFAGSTAVDNKLDLTGTTVPPKRKPTRKTTPKRRPTPNPSVIINNIDFSFQRDSNDNKTKISVSQRRRTVSKRDLTFVNLSKLFTKEDNVTLVRKHTNALRRGYYPAPAPAPPSDYDDVNNYDYNSDSDPPVFIKPGYGFDSGYGQVTEPPPPPPNPYYAGGYYATTEEPPPPPPPPYCTYCYNQPPTTYNPYIQDTRRPLRGTTPKRGLTNKIITADYDYDPNNRQTTRRPQFQRTTTVRNVFQRPGLLVINDNRPNDKPIFLSPSSSAQTSLPSQNSPNANVFLQNSKNPSASAASQSVFSVDTRPQFSSSRPTSLQSAPLPIFSQKKTSHKKPVKELRNGHVRLPSKLTSTFDHNYDYDNLVPDPHRPDILNVQEHDGYLRPEQNKYEPLKKTIDFETYRNYYLYNTRDAIDTVPYTIPQNTSLWTSMTQVDRYAAQYQQPLELDDDLDQFVGPYIDQEKLPDFNRPDSDRFNYLDGDSVDLRQQETTFSADRISVDQHATRSNIKVTDNIDYYDDDSNTVKAATPGNNKSTQPQGEHKMDTMLSQTSLPELNKTLTKQINTNNTVKNVTDRATFALDSGQGQTEEQTKDTVDLTFNTPPTDIHKTQPSQNTTYNTENDDLETKDSPVEVNVNGGILQKNVDGQNSTDNITKAVKGIDHTDDLHSVNETLPDKSEENDEDKQDLQNSSKATDSGKPMKLLTVTPAIDNSKYDLDNNEDYVEDNLRTNNTGQNYSTLADNSVLKTTKTYPTNQTSTENDASYSKTNDYPVGKTNDHDEFKTINYIGLSDNNISLASDNIGRDTTRTNTHDANQTQSNITCSTVPDSSTSATSITNSQYKATSAHDPTNEKQDPGHLETLENEQDALYLPNKYFTLDSRQPPLPERQKFEQTGTADLIDLLDSDIYSSRPQLDFIDTNARTANRPDILSDLPTIEPQTNSSNELPKLPRFDLLVDHSRQPQSDNNNNNRDGTTTERPIDRPVSANAPRRRRPIHRKRPTTHRPPLTLSTIDRRPTTGIALVPFVLLTSIERPDNWVMFNVAKSKKRNPLPEVPQLKSELFSLSELPKPISAED